MSRCFPANDHENDNTIKLNHIVANSKSHKVDCCCHISQHQDLNKNINEKSENSKISHNKTIEEELKNIKANLCHTDNIAKNKFKDSSLSIKKNGTSRSCDKKIGEDCGSSCLDSNHGCTISWMDSKFDELIDSNDISFVANAIKSVNNGYLPSNKEFEILKKISLTVGNAFDDVALSLDKVKTDVPLSHMINSSELEKIKDIPVTFNQNNCNFLKSCSNSTQRLTSHIDCNEQDIQSTRNDYTPLMEACYTNQADVVELLLSRGANINAQSSSGNTALHCACENGHYDIVKLLLGKGAKVEVQNDNGHTPLMETASAGHVHIAKLLLENGSDINAHSSEYKESALTLACYRGRLDMVKFLLNKGADWEHKTEDMHTALMEASMDGHVDVAKLLIERGAKVNMPEDSFESPLMLAASGGHLELAKLLIDYGADLNEVNDEGYTPLMEACREGFLSMVELLIKSGADVNYKTEETQETCLTLACCGGYLDIVKYLMDPSINADIELGIATPLIEASTEGYYDIVHFLLSKGAKVHAKTLTGDTALCYACENGHTSVVDLLINNNADIEHQSDDGRTPIMKAAKNGHFCTVEYLISRNANFCKLSSNNEHTPLSLAASNGHSHVVRLLLSRLADPLSKLKDDSNALIEACKNGHYSTSFVIIESIYHYQQIKKEMENNGQQQFINGCCCTEHLQSLANESVLMHQLNDDDNDCISFICKDSRCPIRIHQAMLSMSTIDGEICPCIEHHWSIVLNELGISCGYNHQNSKDTPCCNNTLNTNNPCTCLYICKEDENGSFDLMAIKKSLAATIHDKVSHHKANIKDRLIPKNEKFEIPINCKKNKELKTDVIKILSSNIIDWKTDSTNETALSFAAANGHEKIVLLLIENGANVNHRDKRGFSPLISAATAGHTSICKLLLDHNADIHLQTERTRETALSYAASAGKHEVVELLLLRGSDPEHRNLSDYTPLSLAASNGCIPVMKCLLAHSVDVNSRIGTKLGITPLMLASMNGHVSAVLLLLDHGADVDTYIETNRNTALTLACYQGRHEVVSLLLEKKANIEHRAKTGYTPLMEAASGGYTEVAKLLLNARADVNAPALSVTRDTALTIASEKGHAAFVELLLSKGAFIDAKNKKNHTALWLAANGGHSEIVKSLCANGADPNITDLRGLSALMIAFRKGNEKVVKILVKKVNQFPSDSDCRRYMSTATETDLQKNLCKCLDAILEAKQRQEIEAERHASSLLKDIDLERIKEETRKVSLAKKRDRKKRQRKIRKSKKTYAPELKNNKNNHIDENEIDSSNSDYEIELSNSNRINQSCESNGLENQNDEKSNHLLNNNDCDGWQEVSKKMPFQGNGKITIIIPASMVSRLIGRNGCNINLIRESTNANIDINTNKKLPSGDCYITIKGAQSSCSLSLKMINLMIEHIEWSVKDVLDFLDGSKITKPDLESNNSLKDTISQKSFDRHDGIVNYSKSERPINKPRKQTENNRYYNHINNRLVTDNSETIPKRHTLNFYNQNRPNSTEDIMNILPLSVERFLLNLGLEKYVKTFLDDEIDMEALHLMNDKDFEEMGLDQPSRCKLMLELIKLSQSKNKFIDQTSSHYLSYSSNVNSMNVINWKNNSNDYI